MLSARIPAELKRLVDVDERTNQDVVQAALWREFGGERKAAIDRRIEEKESRINIIERERQERVREIEEERKELDALKAKKDKVQTKAEDEHSRVLEKAETIPADPNNPFVREHATKLDLTPEELAKEIAETHNKPYNPFEDEGLDSL